MARSTTAYMKTILLFVPPRSQQPFPLRPGSRSAGSQVISSDVKDGRVTFRILAPKAQAVKLTGGDMPGLGEGKDLTKGTSDVSEVTMENVKPGYYRYKFNVDGVAVIDP